MRLMFDKLQLVDTFATTVDDKLKFVGLRSPMVIMIMFLPIIVVAPDGPQKILNGPICYLPALFPRGFVCKAEVNAGIDAGVYHVLLRV